VKIDKGAEMKRKGFQIVTLFLLVSMMLCGCGTSMYEMTEEEEAVIIRYAAYVLAKHNVYQKDGMVAVNPELLEPETEEETEDETPTDEQDTQIADNETQDQTGTSSSSQTEQSDTISLAEAVGYGGQADISYTGFFVTDNFQEGKAYSLDAHTGYKFVVAQFTMKNTSGAALDVNVMATNPTFRMSYDGTKWVKEDVTLLLTDLSTYTGSLENGESVDLVLLFEVSDDVAESIEQLSFSVDKDGVNYLVN
jgi:hypothetical protein